jgi:5'-3' exonuclease
MRRADSEGFDKHQISPGTPFMKKLATTLKFIYPELEVSDTSEAGEGEHKIFTWLQRMPETDRKSICIYGLDADLVVIALAQSHLGNIQVLRETETGFASLSIQALERVLPIDKETYIRMSIMCFGNDFMPTLAMFSLREDGYARAVYYANRNDADKDETKLLVKRSSNANRRVIAVDGHALESRFGCHLMDGVVDWEPVCFAFWKTYEWTYHYFTTSEVLDWEWVYPYPEAPLLQTIDFYERPTEFVWDHPTPTMTVEEQLQFILPEHSLHTTGITSTFPDELYNEETETRNLWMKRFAWETDPWVSLPRGTLTTVSEFPLM